MIHRNVWENPERKRETFRKSGKTVSHSSISVFDCGSWNIIWQLRSKDISSLIYFNRVNVAYRLFLPIKQSTGHKHKLDHDELIPMLCDVVIIILHHLLSNVTSYQYINVLTYEGDKRSHSLVYSEESPSICTYFVPDPWDASPCFEEEEKVKGLSQSTFIILSLHFLPDESTSTFTVFKRWQNS